MAGYSANVVTLTVGGELSGQIAFYTEGAVADDQGNVVAVESLVAADADGNVVADQLIVAADADGDVVADEVTVVADADGDVVAAEDVVAGTVVDDEKLLSC